MSSTSSSATTIRRRIGAREFASTFGTNLAIQLCTVVQGIIVARLLGPTGRGQFAAAILWPSVFAGVGGLGLTVALARRSAQADDPARIVRAGLLLSIATGLVATLGCALALPYLMASVDGVSRQSAWYFLPYIVLNHVTQAMISIDHGAARFTAFNLTRLVLNPVYLVLLCWLWVTGTTDVWWFVMSLLAANAAVMVLRVGAAGWRHSLVGAVEPLGAVLRDALPFGLAGFVSPLLQYADKALLLYLLGTTELGLYSVALAAASIANSLTTSAGAISFGIGAQVHEENTFERVARVFRLTAWLWLIVGIVLGLVIPILLPLIYGADFSAAVWPAILLIPAGAFAGQSSVLEESMRAQGRAFIGLEARLMGMSVFLLAGWFLATRAGLNGVAVAFNAAQLVALVFMIFMARWHYAGASLGRLRPRLADLADLVRRVADVLKQRNWLASK